MNDKNDNNNNFISKKFDSIENLRYEKERLETFINWPISDMITPEELAADGFCFLRDLAYCKCIFCNGVVGEWEVGDVARTKHARLFPQCSFIQIRYVDYIVKKVSRIC